MPEPLIDVTDLSVTYERRRAFHKTRDTVRYAVSGADISVNEGESFAIVGESGSGKSTLARAPVGLLTPDHGEICYAGAPLSKRRSREQRRAIQMIFQDPYSSLNPRMTVKQTIEEALKVHHMRSGPDVDARVEELLSLVNLPGRLAELYPRTLSGGQRQRVSIARALACEPRLLIADEPTSALDVSVQAAVLNLFADLRSQLGLTLIMITHNLAVVRHVSERVAVMYDGEIVEMGDMPDVMDHPRHDYTRSLLASVPSLAPKDLDSLPPERR